MNTWIVATDPRRLYGMLDTARPVSEKITIAYVGTTGNVGEYAQSGVDRVVLFEIGENTPVELAAAEVAAAAAADGATLVLGNDGSEPRCLLGACAGVIDAAVLGAVQTIEPKENGIVAGNKIAAGKAIEEVACSALIGVYTGADADATQTDSCPIDIVSVNANDDSVLRFEEAEGTGLATAARIVCVGMGVGNRDNLALTEVFANALGAETACTLPCCEDMRWFPEERVLGSSHNSAAPDLYIGIGVSGSPNHTSGVSDSKVLVAINNNPDAEIFGCCAYGIVGDLCEVVPALTEALKR